MKHFISKEKAPVILGTVVLAGYSLVESSSNIQETLVNNAYGNMFLDKSAQLSIIIFGTVILLIGLMAGLKRHKDISPITFAILGASVLLLSAYWQLPPIITILCGICFLISGTWNIALPKSTKIQYGETPSFNDFLDNTIISELENVE